MLKKIANVDISTNEQLSIKIIFNKIGSMGGKFEAR